MTTTIVRHLCPLTMPRLRLLPILLVLLAGSLGAQGRGGLDSTYRAPASVRGSGPGGATLRCADGSLAAPGASDAACSAKGGVGARYPLLRTPGAVAAPAPNTSSAPTVTPASAPATSPEVPRPTPAPASTPSTSARPPVDATLLCGDGSYIRADTASTRCASRGGVRIRFIPRVRQP